MYLYCPQFFFFFNLWLLWMLLIQYDESSLDIEATAKPLHNQKPGLSCLENSPGSCLNI